jgi:large subunit ribosomal protein L35
MPKMKTHKGAAKRFTFTGRGIMRQQQGRHGHFRRRKATRLLQRLNRMNAVARGNLRRLRGALPYGRRFAQ